MSVLQSFIFWDQGCGNQGCVCLEGVIVVGYVLTIKKPLGAPENLHCNVCRTGAYRTYFITDIVDEKPEIGEVKEVS